VDERGDGSGGIVFWIIPSKHAQIAYIDYAAPVRRVGLYWFNELHPKDARGRDKKYGVGQRDPMKQTIVFALGSYMLLTYTWVYNQLRFLKNIDWLILASMIHLDRIYFPLKHHKLFSFPGLEALKKPGIPRRIIRRLLRFIFIDSRYDLLPNTQPAWKRRYRKLFKQGTLFLTLGEYGVRN
jgi:hypothetical protein